jgi:DNA-binding GntR family transcriptional regulator
MSTQTAGQRAADAIRERILSGTLEPGATLNQNELAELLGISRIPIRDALQFLAAEGLVTLRAHATATVTPLSVEDLQELYDLRLAIEPSLCRQAVDGVRAKDIERMRELLEQMHSAEPSVWLELNRRFHETLYLRAKKPRSTEIIDRIRQATDRYVRIYQSLDHGKVHREHEMILEAVESRQGRRLEALVAAHLSDGYETMLQYLAGLRDTGPPV